MSVWTLWAFDPGFLIPLLLSFWLYVRGWRACPNCVTRWEVTAFVAGWTSLFVALISPLHRMGELLFSAHMTQHEVLMVLAAPLLVVSRPLVPILWAFPMQWRKIIGRWKALAWLTTPVVAWAAHAIMLWIWHAPSLFQATLTSGWVHAAQHISFFGSALLFWWSAFHHRKDRGMALLYIFTTAVHTSILGALLTFSSSPWYPAYSLTAPDWGLSALEDQQLGGLIMWVPAGVSYLVAALVLVAEWLRESELRVVQREA